MDVKKDEDEMPVPDYAEGTRILLIEPNMASRRHVIPLLQAATYRVKSTGFANAALSMIRAAASKYDLVVASTQMQGMDCVTFLTTLKTFSNIPVVLISNEVNNQLAIKTLKLGACQFFERPILRYDARCLWQHVFSKGKKKATNDAKNEENELHQSDNSDQLVMDYKGKGIQREFPEKGVLTADGSTGSKQNKQEIQKRKRSDDNGEEETGQPGIDKPENSAAAARSKNMKSNNNPGKGNAELLTNDKGKAISAVGQQDFGTTDMILAQHSKTTGHPNSETVPSPTLNLGNKSRSGPKFEFVTGAQKDQHGTGSSSFQQDAQLYGTPKLNFENNISLINNNHMTVNEIINKQPKFKGRIDYIRHEYWTDTQPGNGTFIANYGYHGSSSSDLGYYSPSSARPPHQSHSSENHVQPMLQTYYRLQTETTGCFHLPYSDSNYNSMYPSDSLANHHINDSGRENLENFRVMYSSEANLNNADASNAQQPTEDDLIFEEILAELRDDFLTNNDLSSLGFSEITGL